MPAADYHAAVRDAVAAALAAAALGPAVEALDDVADVLRVKSLPAVGVVCVGPEQERPEFGTNERTGLGYPVMVGLFTAGATSGEKSPDAPDLTRFRRAVWTLFDKKRLAGVDEVCQCEVSGQSPLFDRDEPAFQRLSTALIVVAVGRFPRS